MKMLWLRLSASLLLMFTSCYASVSIIPKDCKICLNKDCSTSQACSLSQPLMNASPPVSYNAGGSYSCDRIEVYLELDVKVSEPTEVSCRWTPPPNKQVDNVIFTWSNSNGSDCTKNNIILQPNPDIPNTVYIYDHSCSGPTLQFEPVGK